jgi:hypothetical protein
MLNVVSGENGTIFSVNASLTGIAVYLDNFAIMDLAEGSTSRRERFLAAIQSGRSGLLFSISNVVDLTGPQGASLDAVRTFLDEIGPHWFPVELDPAIVVERERNGAVPAMTCLSERFLRDYFADRLRTYSGTVIDLSPNFFRLGHVLDWIEHQRESIRHGMAELDAALIKKIQGCR